MFSFLAVTIPFFVGTATFAQYQEAITGQSLIGSHFGVPGFNASFDYVVVGAGTAGLAMATRLAEDGRNSVAVIEGGSFYEFDNGNLSSIPAYASYYLGSDPLFRNPQIDWGITSKPQEVCKSCREGKSLLTCLKGLDDRTFLYAAGRTLGGSSARNLMLYHRYVPEFFKFINASPFQQPSSSPTDSFEGHQTSVPTVGRRGGRSKLYFRGSTSIFQEKHILLPTKRRATTSERDHEL